MRIRGSRRREPIPTLADVVYERRLRLRRLVPAERALIGVTLLVTGLCGVLLLWESVPLRLPGGSVIADRGTDDLAAELVPTLVMTVGCLGMAAASAVFAYGTTRPGWRAPVFTRALLALPAASIATTAYLADVAVPGTAGVPQPIRYLSLALVVGELALPLVPSRAWKRTPLAFALAVAAAWATAPLLYLLDLEVAQDYGVTSRIAATWTFLNVAIVVVFALQVIEGVRASVDVLHAPAILVRSRGAWVLGLAVALAVVLLLGVAGVLPDEVGGASQAWDRAAEDDVVAWLLGGVVAAAVVALAARPDWLRTGRREPDRAVVAVVAAWTATFVAAMLFSLAGSVWQVVDLHVTWPHDAANAILRATQELEAAVVCIAGATGGALLLRTDHRVTGAVLALFGVWNAPAAYALVTRGHGSGVGGAPELVTVALLVAVVTALVAAGRWRRGDPIPPGLALALLVFAALALAEPAHDLLRDEVSNMAFYAGLLLPAVYLYLADARRYEPHGGRASPALLAVTGLTAMALSVALIRVSLGTLTPETRETGFIRYTLVVPLAATVVALAARRQSPPLPASTGS